VLLLFQAQSFHGKQGSIILGEKLIFHRISMLCPVGIGPFIVKVFLSDKKIYPRLGMERTNNTHSAEY
jgi:hypothetical protein